MYKIVRRQVRPHKQVAFYGFNRSPNLTAEIMELRESRYVNTGKIVSVQRDMSEDQLTLTTTVIFESKDAMIEYQTDPDLEPMRQDQMEYLATKGIMIDMFPHSEEV